MPRPRPTSSALRAPLDFILGTQGMVRVVRALSATDIPISQAELARRTALSPSGIPALLATLETAGIVTYVGRGRTRQVQLQRSHPLVGALLQLFREEADRWRRIQHGLRELLGAISGELLSAWIEGPVTQDRDRFNDTLTVGILSESPMAISMQETLRQRTNQLQATHHVVVSLQYYQRADLLRFTPARRALLSRAQILFGPAPVDILDAAAQRPHRTKRGRRQTVKASVRGRPSAKAIAVQIAERMVRDPEIIDRARMHIQRRLPLAGDVERLALLEWQGLLDSMTAGQLAALLRSDTERADTLRQNLPFVGALSDAERAELFSLPKT